MRSMTSGIYEINNYIFPCLYFFVNYYTLVKKTTIIEFLPTNIRPQHDPKTNFPSRTRQSTLELTSVTLTSVETIILTAAVNERSQLGSRYGYLC